MALLVTKLKNVIRKHFIGTAIDHLPKPVKALLVELAAGSLLAFFF